MNQQSKRNGSKMMEYFHSEKFKPTKWAKYFATFSIAIFLVGLIMFFVLGFNLGLDFTGGNVMDVKAGIQIENAATRTEVESVIESVLQENGVTSGISRVQVVNSGEDAVLEFQYQNVSGLTTAEMTAINTQIQADLQTQLADVLTGDVNSMVTASETKSASASSELVLNAFFALAIAIIAILIYVGIRFELISGLAAIIALFHDVLLMCALVVICRIEINSAFIAAIITVLGYSINNTIVLFDRIRENLKKETLANKTNMQIADLSIKQTFNRTLNTSLTTILAVIFLAIIGVSAIQEFIIPIIFGIVVGTYAAVFISAPLWAVIISHSKFDKHKIKEVEKVNKEEQLKVIETTAESIID